MKRWLTAVFVVVMLSTALYVAWHTATETGLIAVRDDIASQLDLSRQRERKQTFELNQAIEALPVAQADLARVRPEADAAEAKLSELKAERKALRSRVSAAEEALAEQESIRLSLVERTEALHAHIAALLAE